jgi:hypothetical protein
VLLPVRSQFCLNRVREISTHETKIPDAKKLGLCREYPQVYMIGYGCRKILILRLTGFWGRSRGQPDGGMLQREVLKATPQAERACQEAAAVDRSAARKILHRRSEPYNQKATHAQWMTDGADSRDHRFPPRDQQPSHRAVQTAFPHWTICEPCGLNFENCSAAQGLFLLTPLTNLRLFNVVSLRLRQ